MKTTHDPDCTIFNSVFGGRRTDGICTCGYALGLARAGDRSQFYSEEIREWMEQERQMDQAAQAEADRLKARRDAQIERMHAYYERTKRKPKAPHDGGELCDCDAATVCPLGRVGSEARCTLAEKVAEEKRVDGMRLGTEG